MTFSLCKSSRANFLLAFSLLGLTLPSTPATAAETVRFMTYNASLNRAFQGTLIQSLRNGNDQQAKNVAEIVQRVRPDVLLVNEFDYDSAGTAASLWHDNYLGQGQMGAAAIAYPYRYLAESNTGIHSGFDLNNNGIVNPTIGGSGYGDDCFGFGAFPGQFGMVVYSKYPIQNSQVRTFQHFLWKDMPGALLPDDSTTPGVPADYYSPAELDVFRLSSKSHWDLPVDVNGETVHLLASHPTPPVFDGAEDRNGRRNFDEIRLWRDYVTPGAGNYLYDDAGGRGGIGAGAKFVMLGDQNSDPLDGDSLAGAANQLTDSTMFNHSVVPSSAGGVEDSLLEGPPNNSHRGNPTNDTADFGGPGNLRVDYVLPSANMGIARAEVFWPLTTDPLYRLQEVSDHLPVWVDVVVPEPSSGALVISAGVFLVALMLRKPMAQWSISLALALLAIPGSVGAAEGTVRFATFNLSLNRPAAGQLITDFSTVDNEQARTVAEIIQRVKPDVLLVNEFDYDAEGRAAELFCKNYLQVAQNVSGHTGASTEPIGFPHRYFGPVNTGVPSGFDLDHDRASDKAADAFGFGQFPGQYGMLLLSKFPFRTAEVRTLQKFLWKDMPGALLPDDDSQSAAADWYSADVLSVFRLSSKSHWDVPVEIDGHVIHVLASHPTPPGFDGKEDRNGRRNHDEIRLWADYLTGGEQAAYLYDDAGRRGGIEPSAMCVVMGDQNADPADGQSVEHAIRQLLNHSRMHADPAPASPGAAEQTQRQGKTNVEHQGAAANDTADFPEPPGNLRVDYVMPTKNLTVAASGVFWPAADDPLFKLVGVYPYPSSDHRLVWVDLKVPGK